MAGSARVVRYLVFAFIAIVVLFFISSSSNRVPSVDNLHKGAVDLLHSQSQRFRGGSNSRSQPSSQEPSSPSSFSQGPSDDASGVGAAGKASPNAPITPNPHLSTSQTQLLSGGVASGTRMNATFVTLARNSDLWEISRSIRQVEDRFNRKYNYDWVFLNDAEFDDTFKKVTTALTSGKARYGKIGPEHWGFPDFIDQDKARKVREDMQNRKIIYGDSISYRHMCRYESGFFFRHPIMNEYEWYWRVEPSIELFCDIDYDPFEFMAKNNKKYSFVISLYEYGETIETLWQSVKKFIKNHPEHIVKDNMMEFLSDDKGETYNNCHFWSNFEIGSLDWLRSKAYIDYFTSLDHDGGFFYERWGDAPVHSIAAGLMLRKDEVHFFNDIAYYHVPFTHCPTGEDIRLKLKCHCNPQDNFDWNGYSCTARYYELQGQAKPIGYEKEQ